MTASQNPPRKKQRPNILNLFYDGTIDPVQNPFYYYKRTFVIALLLAAMIIFPFVISDYIRTGSPVFLYYGDYNVQQIPFYEHCVRMVHEGSLGWDWNTDLGSNFIGSYSYYLLGSPFFWIMCLFPASWAPYLMAPIYVLKFAVAALFAFAFLQRFVKDKSYAVIGALLYAFCGFQIYNVFFNQFHEVVAFFPLLLIGMEESVQNNRKGVFALAVALNAMCNYFMFAGQVVFCIFYFFMRCSHASFRITLKRFLLLALEAVTGVLISAVLFLPAALGLLGNTRLSYRYSGWDMLYYYSGGELYGTRYGHILQSLFFPPDIPSRVNFFYGHDTRWASNAAWLPLIGMSGFFAYAKSRPKSRWTSFIVFLVLCALIPLMNSSFFLLNSSYYARWVYMLVMMLCVVTVVALEDKRIRWQGGIAVNAAVCTAMAAYVGLKWFLNDEVSTTTYALGSEPFAMRLWISVAIALGSLIVLYLIIKRYRGTKAFQGILLIACCVVIVLYSVVHIFCGKEHSSSVTAIVNEAINGDVVIDDDDFYRIDFFRREGVYTGVYDNLGISWEIPSTECFHTVVPPSIMVFYDKVATGRAVGSRMDYKYYGLRPFLSVKYSLIKSGSASKHYLDENGYQYSQIDTQNNYAIFEDANYLGMGFHYDYFITESQFEKIAKSNRHTLLCKYLVVPDDMREYYAQFMTEVVDPSTVLEDGDTRIHRIPANQESFEASLEERRQDVCDTFTYDSYSFTATTTLDSANVVFFSVPYESGWSAEVNGEKRDVLQVTYGFVAVQCDAGANTIVFRYETPGLKYGAILTVIGLLILVALLLIARKKKKLADYHFFTETYYETEEGTFLAKNGKAPENGNEFALSRGGGCKLAGVCLILLVVLATLSKMKYSPVMPDTGNFIADLWQYLKDAKWCLPFTEASYGTFYNIVYPIFLVGGIVLLICAKLRRPKRRKPAEPAALPEAQSSADGDEPTESRPSADGDEPTEPQLPPIDLAGPDEPKTPDNGDDKKPV